MINLALKEGDVEKKRFYVKVHAGINTQFLK